MTIQNMAFSPEVGLRDIVTYPAEPVDEAAAREQVQGRMDELKDYINDIQNPGIDRRTLNAKTDNYTIIADDLNETITMTGTKTVTFPLIATSGFGTGFRCRVSNIGTGTVTVASTSTDTIAGAASISLAPKKSIEVVADAAGIWTVHGFDFTDIISTKVNPNAIINGCFRINQRAVSGTVTLAAGVYGHDRWKAGASGCTYTFAESGGVTTLTITAGSLIQTIEGTNLETGTYVLSWTGTATGKIGAGSLSASGVTGSVTGGSNLNIEFGTGTLSKVKFETGSMSTPFIKRPVSEELSMCYRYYYRMQYISGDSQVPIIGFGFATSATNVNILVSVPTYFRAVPAISYASFATVRVIDSSVALSNPTAIASAAASNRSCLVISFTLASATANRPYWADLTTGGYIGLDAEL